MNVINESSNEAIVRVLADGLRTTCQIFEVAITGNFTCTVYMLYDLCNRSV